MADVLAAMTALASMLDADDVKVRGYVGNQDDPTVPCWIVKVPDVDYLETFGGDVKLTFSVRYLVERTNAQAAQEDVAAVMATGAASGTLNAVIEADGTLDGTVDWATVLRARNFGSYTYGEITYLGCEFDVEAQAS